MKSLQFLVRRASMCRILPIQCRLASTTPTTDNAEIKKPETSPPAPEIGPAAPELHFTNLTGDHERKLLSFFLVHKHLPFVFLDIIEIAFDRAARRNALGKLLLDQAGTTDRNLYKK